MREFNINNKEYLLSLKPKFLFIPCFMAFIIIMIMISLFYFKSYDRYLTKGYLSCDDICNIIISVNTDDINVITNASLLKIGDKIVNINNKEIKNIEVDEVNKINYQNVVFYVDQLDKNIINTFQDIKIYSNYESIIQKIKKILI